VNPQLPFLNGQSWATCPVRTLSAAKRTQQKCCICDKNACQLGKKNVALVIHAPSLPFQRGHVDKKKLLCKTIALNLHVSKAQNWHRNAQAAACVHPEHFHCQRQFEDNQTAKKIKLLLICD